MAVTFVSIATAGTTGSATGSVVCNVPGSPVAGNTLLAFVWLYVGSGSPTINTPSGWTLVNGNGNTVARVACFTRTVASEPASYTFTGSTGNWTSAIAQYTPAAADGTSVNLGTLTPWSTSAFTAGTAGDLVAVGSGNGPNNGTSPAVPAGTTSRANQLFSGGSGGAYVNVCDATAASTAVPAYSAAMVANVNWGAVAVALKVATPPTVSGTASITVGPVNVSAAAAGGVSGCARVAYLTLAGQTLPLEDPAKGYFCSSLDLGYPAPRDNVVNRPDQHGAVDRTAYMGVRTVNVQIEALQGAGARIDDVASAFAPFMAPAARPVLHYALDRPDAPVERTLTVRGGGYTWPIQGAYQRSIQLQFVAADPVAYDPRVNTVTATTATTPTLFSQGDIPARPLLRITGPITGPTVTITPTTGPAWVIDFANTFTIAAGHFVDVDTAARTVYADANPALPRLASLDWTQSSWQWLAPAPSSAVMALAGTATSGATQVTATWQDGYLS